MTNIAQTDAEILNASREQNAYWRRLMNRLGIEFTERVIRIEHRNELNGEVLYTDIYIEVETEHAKACVIRFQSGESMSAAVLKNGTQGFLGGTWRKYGKLRGHAIAWYRTQRLGRRQASPNSKKTDRCCPAVIHNALMFGVRWTTADHPQHERLGAAMKLIQAEMALERAQAIVAQNEATMAIAAQA